MELQVFAGVVSEAIREKMGQDYRISVIHSQNNNSTERMGILFMHEGEDVSPTIYINDLLDDYNEDEKTLADIVQEVIDRYYKSLEAVGDVHRLNIQLEACRERVIYRLISRERNKRLLRELPYIPFLDMAITFHVVIGLNKKYMQTVKVDKKLQKYWDVSVEQLFKMAKDNTERILPLEICGMSEIVSRQAIVDENDLARAKESNMIVLTNEAGIYGAAAILYDGVMEVLAGELDTDMYVIPSSVHEMILLPAEEDDIYEALSIMIKEINRRFVDVGDVLSDRVYLYLKEEKKFIKKTP